MSNKNIRNLSGVVRITPALASAMLETNTRNRKIKNSVVDRYVRLMREGEWGITNDAITFDKNGVLTNGQHRLEAVVRSGVTIDALVFQNIGQSVYMDRGTTRTQAENLDITEGRPHVTGAVNCISMYYKMYDKTVGVIPEGTLQYAYRILEKSINAIPEVFKDKKKAFSYGADYMSAILLLLYSDKFQLFDIQYLHEKLMNGEFNLSDPRDKLLKSLRDDAMRMRGVFARDSKRVSGPIARSEEFIAFGLAYLNGKSRKARPEPTKKFIQETLDRLFTDTAELIQSKNYFPDND